MIDWDDVRYLLAVAREGSVRAAAERLEVNHSTVLRRVAQLEERLGAQMFEKLRSGYRPYRCGEEVLEFAEQMKAWSNQLAARVWARPERARAVTSDGSANPRYTPAHAGFSPTSRDFTPKSRWSYCRPTNWSI